jgi:hypothetical protein
MRLAELGLQEMLRRRDKRGEYTISIGFELDDKDMKCIVP